MPNTISFPYDHSSCPGPLQFCAAWRPIALSSLNLCWMVRGCGFNWSEDQTRRSHSCVVWGGLPQGMRYDSIPFTTTRGEKILIALSRVNFSTIIEEYCPDCAGGAIAKRTHISWTLPIQPYAILASLLMLFASCIPSIPYIRCVVLRSNDMNRSLTGLLHCTWVAELLDVQLSNSRHVDMAG